MLAGQDVFFDVHNGTWAMYMHNGTLGRALFPSCGSLGGWLGFCNCWDMALTGNFPWALRNFFFWGIRFRKHAVYFRLLHFMLQFMDWLLLSHRVPFLGWDFIAAWQQLQIRAKKNPMVELPRGDQSGRGSGPLAAIMNFSAWHEAFLWSGSSFKAVFTILLLVPSELTTVK